MPVCVRGAIFFSVCLSVCVTFVVLTDCESCTRPISTNPRSMEAGECGLARWTCFVPRRLEVVTVAGLLWISWCVLGPVGFPFFVFSFERTRPAASVTPPCLFHLSNSIHTCNTAFSPVYTVLADEAFLSAGAAAYPTIKHYCLVKA